MSDQRLVDALEKALTDEAYDGGMGYLGDEQFPVYVRTLAETAAAVIEKAHAPTDDEREALTRKLADEPEYRVRTAVALAKGGHGIDDQVTEGRASVARILAAGSRRTEVPEQSEPSDAPAVQLMARKGGKTQALIDQVLKQANEHGIRVEIVNQAIPRYAMLDVWMALYGHDNSQAFDGFHESAGYAEAWATLLAAIRARAGEPQGEPSDAMVKAACEEYSAISFQRRVPQAYMRSALRAALHAAAGVVGQEGESHG